MRKKYKDSKKRKTSPTIVNMPLPRRYVYVFTKGKLLLIDIIKNDNICTFLCPEHGEFQIPGNDAHLFMFCPMCNTFSKQAEEKPLDLLHTEHHISESELNGMSYYGFKEDAYETEKEFLPEKKKGGRPKKKKRVWEEDT